MSNIGNLQAQAAVQAKADAYDSAVAQNKMQVLAGQAREAGAAEGYTAGLATLASMYKQAPQYNPFQMMALKAETQGLGGSGRPAENTGYYKALDATANSTVYPK